MHQRPCQTIISRVFLNEEKQNEGYSKSLACGTICGAGTLGILIPPSIMLVMMADRLGLPVGDLFMGALFLTIVNGRFNFKVLKTVVHQTFRITAYIFAIVIGATCFALVLRELGGDALVEETLTNLPFGPYGIVAFILGIVFFLGFFLDWIEITLIILPLLAPVIPSLGIDLGVWSNIDNPTLIWFAILVAVVLQTSFLTPPVGFAIFYLR